jgi:hypothetical protein
VTVMIMVINYCRFVTVMIMMINYCRFLTVMVKVINYCPFRDGDDNDDKLLPFL